MGLEYLKTLPEVGARVVAHPTSDERGTVIGAENNRVAIRWDAGGMNSYPPHFGTWVITEEEVSA